MQSTVNLIGALLTGGVALWLLQSFGRWNKARLDRKRKKANLVTYLRGLPYEMKAVLVNYHVQGTHTLRGNPTLPPVDQLLKDGALRRGVSGGGYEAICTYLKVPTELWEIVRSEWPSLDPGVGEIIARVMAMPEQAAEEIK